MARYSRKALVMKLGMKKGARAAALGSPVAYEELLGGLPDEAKVAISLRGTVDFIHFFAQSESELRTMFPKLKKSLVENGMLWVSWPKGASKVLVLPLAKPIKTVAGAVSVDRLSGYFVPDVQAAVPNAASGTLKRTVCPPRFSRNPEAGVAVPK